MKLYLARHGEAENSAADTDPGLSVHGQRQAAEVAGFLKDRNVTVERIYHSTKRRAQQTAEVYTPIITEGMRRCERQGLQPTDPVMPIAMEVQEWSNDVMLVGHLPFMHHLASCLLLQDEHKEFIAFTPATVVCLERIEGLWFMRWCFSPD